MRSSLPITERAQALLGTYVSVRVRGFTSDAANKAIDTAFAEVARIHRLMSFQDSGSDVARLNRSAHLEPVTVDPSTYEVLKRSAELSSASDGAFDITTASRLVASGALQRPASRDDADPAATWRDIGLLEQNRVAFHRPLWIDLSGIAKGYAVDRAIEAVLQFKPAQVCVNAGGDLRVAGSDAELVRLRAGESGDIPVVEIRDASIASSAATMHVDPSRAAQIPKRRFVSVIAQRCIDADACTKIVMVRPRSADKTLRALSARGLIYEPLGGWREVA
jgi:thiamine biosynthesis lipoprotein